MAIYLIDYENVYVEGLKGLEKLDSDDEIIIFYTQNRCLMTFEVHQQLIASRAAVSLMEVEVSSKSKNTVKNALDLQLSMYIGYLLGRRPDVPLYIVSRDTDFDLNLSFYAHYLHHQDVMLFVCASIEDAVQGATASSLEEPAQEEAADPPMSESEQNAAAKSLYQRAQSIVGAMDNSELQLICKLLTAAGDLQSLHKMLALHYHDNDKVQKIYKKIKPLYHELQKEQSDIPGKLQQHVRSLTGKTNDADIAYICQCVIMASDLVALNNNLSLRYHDGQQVKDIYHKLKPAFQQLCQEARYAE